MDNIENLTANEIHFLANEGTLILSIVDETFWEKFRSYEECVNDFKKILCHLRESKEYMINLLLIKWKI